LKAMMETLKLHMKEYFNMATNPQLTPHIYNHLGIEAIKLLMELSIPILVSSFVVAVFINFVQVGPLFTLGPMKPELNKLNPLNGFKRWFSARTVVELVKSVVKLAAVSVLAYQIVKGLLRPLVLSVGGKIENITAFLQDMVTDFTLRVAVVFVVIAAGDFFFQKKQHMKSMKMSKDEVKREYKEEEGDPQHKHHRKQLHQELAMNNMMHNVKKANVIVVNPTRIAVALLYDREKGGAPKVVAKGERLIADKIREMAKEYGIPIMRNISLAQALNKVELGDDIPEELYVAVAEVLNYVYRMEQEHQRA